MPLERLKIAKEVEKQHVQLNKQMSELKSIISSEMKDKNFAEWRLHFLWKLRDLKNALLKHFDLEEEGGFMHEVLKAAPQEANKVESLIREHGEIIASLDAVLQDLKTLGTMDRVRLNHIKNGLNHLFYDLGAHENKENHLMQVAYYREFGYPA